MKKFMFEFADGRKVVVEGRTYKTACRKIKIPYNQIVTSFLVRLKEESNKSKSGWGHWGYWDAEQFWKELKKGKEDER